MVNNPPGIDIAKGFERQTAAFSRLVNGRNARRVSDYGWFHVDRISKSISPPPIRQTDPQRLDAHHIGLPRHLDPQD